MRSADYDRLKEDISKNGLIDSITLYEGKILDGIHRQRVCDETGIEPHYEDFKGNDPARFVFSVNLARRHMTNGQLAMIGAELEEHFAKEAKKRQGKRTDIRADRPTSSHKRRARDEAAEVVGTSGRSISRAKRIKVKRPDLAADIKAGRMSPSAADGIISADKVRGKQPKQDKKQPRWSGKRLRELHDASRNGDSSEFNKMQLQIAKNVAALETFELPDLDWNDPLTNEIAGFIFEDLEELDKWVTRAQKIAAAHTSTKWRQNKIKFLRNVTIANGYEPGEVENAQRSLERVIENKQLSNGG